MQDRDRSLVKKIVVAGCITQFIAWLAAMNALGADLYSTPTATNTAPAPSATPTSTSTWTPPSPSVTPGSVMALAVALQVGAPHPAGYNRDEFGQKWADVDHNGCDQRNDVLRRDTKKRHTKPGTNGCVLHSGVIKNDRYSYASRQVKYERGSSKVEIDHVVSLADAWRMGAYDWSTKKREKFANDVMNLEAIDAATNRSKDDKSAADWLPEAEPTDICWFVARQVTIKSRYHLAVAQDEKDEMVRGLSSGLCDGNRVKPLSPSKFNSPEPKPIGEPKPKPAPKPTPTQTPRPQPTEPKKTTAPAPRPTVHPGAFCSPAGAKGVGSNGVTYTCKGPGQPRWRR
jgi:hypothetical protein